MTDHAELLRRWQRMYNAMDSKHEDKWPKDDDFQKLRQDTHAALAARPVTPAPTLSEAEFTDWFIKNYYGEVVFSDPAWHAKSIYRRARNYASAPEALIAAICDVFGIGVNARTPDAILENVKNATRRSACLSLVEQEIEGESSEEEEDADRPFLPWGAEPKEYITHFRAALAAPSTPAAEPVNFAHDDLDGQLAEIQRRRDAAPQAQDSAPEALSREGMGRLVMEASTGMHGDVAKTLAIELCAALAAPTPGATEAPSEAEAQPYYDLAWEHKALPNFSDAGDELDGLSFDKAGFEAFCAALAAPSTPAAADIDAAEAVRRAWEGGKALGVALAATQAQASDHVADVSKMVAADLSDAEIDALFLQFAEANERGAMWIRTYVEGFRHLARAILAANKEQS